MISGGSNTPPEIWGMAVRRVLRAAERVYTWVGITLLVAMFLVVCLQIFSRYVMQAPLPWTEEAGRFLFLWTSFLGSAVLVGRSEHFSIDFVERALPPPGRRILQVGVALLVTGFAVLMVYYGSRVSRRMLSSPSAILEVSLGAVYGVIPLSGLYMFLHGLMKLSRTAAIS